METKTIDELPQATKLQDTDRMIVNQVNTSRANLSEVKEYAQGDLPQRINGVLNEAKGYIDQQLSGRNEWLTPVNTTSQLKTIGLSNKISYLCKVVADPVQSGVYQAVAGWTGTPQWSVFDTTVDFVNEQELAVHTGNTNNPHGVTKAQVGLGNVTNDAQVKRGEMGVAGGVATLDSNGKVPSSQLPQDLGGSGEGSSGGEVDVSGKADKVSNATAGNFAGLDANGNLTDSGKNASNFVIRNEMGVANGVASLDSNGKVPNAQLPVISSLLALTFTFVIDSNQKLADWANNVNGNDYSRVLIKAGTWTLNTNLTGGTSSNPLVVIDISNGRTKCVVGESESRIVINNTQTATTYLIGIKGAVITSGTPPIGNEYFILNVDLSITSTGAGSGIGTGFSYCNNLTNCTGTGTNTSTSTNTGAGYGFNQCRTGFGCKNGAIASKTSTFNKCLMAQGTGTPATNDWANTAAGGWNLP